MELFSLDVPWFSVHSLCVTSDPDWMAVGCCCQSLQQQVDWMLIGEDSHENQWVITCSESVSLIK
jgi:hypothetical protein